MKKSIVIEIVCGLLVLLFSYAGFSKLFNHDVFHSQLIIFPLLKHAEPLLSWALPGAELAVVVLLLIQRVRLYGLYCALILLVLFTVYLIVMLLSGVNLPCSCGGVIQYLSWKAHVVFNLFFTALSITAISFQKNLNRDFFTKGQMQSC